MQSGDFVANAWVEERKTYLIHFAAAYADVESVQIRLTYGAQPGCIDGKGRIPIALAIMNGKREVFSLLKMTQLLTPIPASSQRVGKPTTTLTEL